MKKLRRVLVGGVLLLALAAAVGYVNLSRVVRAGVVRQTTDALGVHTAVSSASLAVSGHVLTLAGCAIDNPAGFSNAKLLTLDAVDMDVPYGELRNRPIHINAIHFYGPRLTLERAHGKWNFQALGHPVNEPVRLMIGRVTVTNAVVTLRTNLPGVAPEITVDVPPFALTDVHSSDGPGQGATIPDALLQITTVMSRKAMESGQLSAQIDQILNPEKLVGELLDGVGKSLGLLGRPETVGIRRGLGWARRPTTRE